MLLTRHNLHFYQDLMADLREAVEHDRFAEAAAQWEADLGRGDVEPL